MPVTNEYRLNGWLYIFAIDRLVIGLADYADVGVHASQPIDLDFVPDTLGLRTTYTNSLDFSGNQADSLETYLHIFEYNNEDNLLSSTRIPILPIAQAQVTHEVILPNASGIATLRFFPDELGDLVVYKNFVPLIIGDDKDYTISNDSLDTESETFPPTSIPIGPKRTMVLSIKNPEPIAIYTATYIQDTSVSEYMHLDREQRTILRDHNVVSYTKASDLAVRSKLILVNIIRSVNYNSSYRESGILFDYTVFAR